jgi:hypothetical protein
LNCKLNAAILLYEKMLQPAYEYKT